MRVRYTITGHHPAEPGSGQQQRADRKKEKEMPLTGEKVGLILLEIWRHDSTRERDVAPASWHNGKAVERRIRPDWHATAVRRGPENHVDPGAVKLGPGLHKVHVKAGREPDPAEVEVEHLNDAGGRAMHACWPTIGWLDHRPCQHEVAST